MPVIERDDDPQRFADMVNPDDNLVSKLGILGIEINEKLSEMLPDLRHEYGIVVAARLRNPPYTGGALAARRRDLRNQPHAGGHRSRRCARRSTP